MQTLLNCKTLLRTTNFFKIERLLESHQQINLDTKLFLDVFMLRHNNECAMVKIIIAIMDRYSKLLSVVRIENMDNMFMTRVIFVCLAKTQDYKYRNVDRHRTGIHNNNNIFVFD